MKIPPFINKDNAKPPRAHLQEGWVIANHLLVSFHVAFISSVLNLPLGSLSKEEVLRFIFVSPETIVSAVFMYVSFHTGIALHELGHFLTAVRISALNESILEDIQKKLARPFIPRMLYILGLFARIPYGKAEGVKREKLNYYPDAPFNLAVVAAGPRASRNVALGALPPAVLLLAFGLVLNAAGLIYLGRLLLGIGMVAFLDFLLADSGKYAEFKKREKRAREKAAMVEEISGWWNEVAQLKRKMVVDRLQEVMHPLLGPVRAPWQFRNCGMGGRHTEKDYPESNISMQEAMFLILRARDYQEAQEMTIRLQMRLKEIIEKEEGCRVMGFGLEGGLAPYVDRGSYPLPEVRLWAMMKQAIQECGFRPGEDVAIALDPAMSELEAAYRAEFNVPDSVGMYLFWRDKTKLVMDRDAVLDIYKRAIQEYEIPIASIEDGFSEHDHEGWRLAFRELGDRIFLIGDDLVTTNDRTIEEAAGRKLINSALIKANQIGTLYETLLAMLVALGKGLDLIVSHRSKSPNDDMEAHIALAVNALGLKAGGGANTERLVKYQAVTELMLKAGESHEDSEPRGSGQVVLRKLRASEEPTNAGVPTVGVVAEVSAAEGVTLRFKGSTPLGVSAGSAEAVHLVDSFVEFAEHREVVNRHPGLFVAVEPGVYAFKKDVSDSRIRDAHDERLVTLYQRAQRYDGKGCMNAADNVREIIAPFFEGFTVTGIGLKDIDQALLALELDTARRRGKLAVDANPEDCIQVLQRKQNLGMNAVLSVSLALARAAAYARGEELYEFLREEMLAIVDQMAVTHGVTVKGSRFADYIAALREVAEILEREGKPLHQALREVTGIYSVEEVIRLGKAGEAPKEGVKPGPPSGEPAETSKGAAPAEVSPSTMTEGVKDILPKPHDNDDRVAVAELNWKLYQVFAEPKGNQDTGEAVRSYLETKEQIGSKERPFGIVNNRIVHKDRCLLIPYLSGHELILHLVENGVSRRLPAPKFVPGTIFTDDLIAEAAGFRGVPIDFERMIFIFTGEDTEPFQIARVRDMAKILKIVNETCNRNEGVYWLRYLVARLCNISVDEFLRAKNLQQEVYNLVAQLVVFLNGHLGPRLRALARIVVRNFSSLLGKQNLIDRVWNATIDLAEIHIRGSSIVNEIRRSSHHALGKRTLDLADAYLDFLDTGNQEKLRKMGFTAIAEADAKAREASRPREILDQVVTDLTNLLGRSEIERRIREWEEAYSTSLYQCKFGHSISEELEILVSKGLRPGNRWVYSHHLRILREKAADGSGVNGVGSAFLEDCATFSKLQPGGEGFDAESSEASIRQSVGKFLSEIQQHFQEKLFQSINDILDLHEAKAHSQAFVRMHEFRRNLYQRIRRKGFNQERYYLFHLDILLEEMGYLELRKIAGDYEENGVRIEECLAIIQMCTANLEYNGLFSRELYDFSVILKDPKKSRAEILNVLQHMARTYHKITQRFTAPFERMQHRFGLDDSELRVALGNMQRYLHDLNSVVHFVEFALQYLRAEDREYSPSDSGPEVRDPVPYDIPHLSHRKDVAKIVELPGPPNARELYGGKGSSLLYMSHLNIPTREGFIFPTSYAREGIYSKDPQRVESELFEQLSVLEHDILQRDGTRKRFGDVKNPLVLSVRGGAVFSMPGILKTAVFVGMSDQIVETIARDNPWCAYDSYRRFLDSFARAVWELDLEEFDLVEAEKRRHQVRQKKELPWEAMKEVAEASKRIIRERGFGDQLDRILSDPREQVMSAVRAVGRSWDSDVARRYRELKGISNKWNTAVIVQEMTFGNLRCDQVEIGMDETTASLTGVIARTKMADVGVRVFQGDFKFCAAGDDLVSGVATSFRSIEELQKLLPMLEMRLEHIVAKLRRFMGTDQEIEFTVEDGILSILQSRTSETAADSADGGQLVPGEVTTRGVGVCGAGFRGRVAFNEADVAELKTQDLGDKDEVDGVLLVLENPSPADIPVILCADGLLTARGGSTAHAALAVNGIEDRSFHAVMGAARFHVDTKEHEATMVDQSGKQHRIRKGDIVSIHGSTGEVYVGSRPIIREGIDKLSGVPFK